MDDSCVRDDDSVLPTNEWILSSININSVKWQPLLPIKHLSVLCLVFDVMRLVFDV